VSRHPTTRVLCLVAVAAALAGAVWWAGSSADPKPSGSVSSGPASSAPAFESLQVHAPARSRPAVDVLHGWDLARARAYASGDVAGLRSLYVDGSTAGTTDARILRAFLRRGLRVEGMRMQLLAVEVLAHGRNRWRLRVTDRLHGAVAVAGSGPVAGSGARTPLPRDEASTRTITLQRRQGVGQWQVARVTR
jgi:hypothetical protein